MTCRFVEFRQSSCAIVDLVPPFRRPSRSSCGRAISRLAAGLQAHARHRHNRNIDADHLVDRGRVNVDMRFSIRAEIIEAAGDPVVETGADVDHQIAIMHRHVGLIQAVHAQHAQPVVTDAG